MKHQISKNEHTITVQYIGELKAEDSVKIVNEILSLIEGVAHSMNILMDIRDGFTRGFIPIVKGASLLLPHLKHFNCCYIVGEDEEKYKYALKFFKTLGAAKNKIFFMKTIEEAEADILVHWEHFNRQK